MEETIHTTLAIPQKKMRLHQGQVEGKEVRTRLATYNSWSSFLVGIIDVNYLIWFLRKSNNVVRMGQACGGLESSLQINLICINWGGKNHMVPFKWIRDMHT